MTHISKNSLPDKEYSALKNQLAGLIEKMNRSAAKSFISDLLTPSEQTMLIKRLAAILMLHHGYSSYALEKVLRISSSTAHKYRHQFLSGMYGDFLTTIYKQKKEAVLLRKILKVIDEINAPLGKDRWRYLKKIK